MDDFRIAQHAKVARTFQNIRLFSGMTVLENLMVAQHNTLMRASGYTVGGILGRPLSAAPNSEAIELAKYWLEKVRPDRPRRRSGGRPALWRPAPPRDRPRHVHRARAALPRRTGGRPQPARVRGTQQAAAAPSATRTTSPILLIEHDMSVVMGISDHIVVLDYGQKISDGDPAQVKSRSRRDPRLSGRREKRTSDDGSPPRPSPKAMRRGQHMSEPLLAGPRRRDLLRQDPGPEGRRHRCQARARSSP